MVCPCCCGDPSEEESEEAAQSYEGTKGPVIDRRCTDSPWLFFFLAYCAAYLAGSALVIYSSDTERLWHGKDHGGARCGTGARAQEGKVYYPRLHEDFRQDPYMRKKHGVCVAKCPAQGDEVPDGEKKWFVPLPTVDVANRCIPYEHIQKSNGTLMCAYPKCEAIDKSKKPTKPEQVCGLALDGTQEYWTLGVPDTWLEMGWQRENVPAGVVQERIELMRQDNGASESRCQVVLRRNIDLKMEEQQTELIMRVFTHYTGFLFRQAQILFDNRVPVLIIGLGGSFVCCLAIIVIFPCCVKLMIFALVAGLFAILTAVDYILFVKADLVSGRSGRAFKDMLTSMGIVGALEKGLDSMGVDVGIEEEMSKLLESQDDIELQSTYKWLAVGLAIGIFLLLCIFFAVRKNLHLLASLVHAASQMLRDMPSLLLFPFVTLASLVCWTALLLYTILGAMSVDPERAIDWLDQMGIEHPDDPKILEYWQKTFIWATIFSFLWVYFFHAAVFETTVAGAVSNWYFFRNDRDNNAGTGIHSQGYFFGRPVLYAFGRVMRYHVGSLAFGSFVLTLLTVPRIFLEYLDKEMKGQQELNVALKVAIQAMRCCLWCFDKCLKWLTSYAYMNVAVSGRSFCRAAHASFVLLAKYPVQVGLDRMASAALKTMSCLLVPLCMVVVVYLMLKQWLVCGAVVGLLSYMVTANAVGVYDVCLSSLLICLIDDLEKYGGQYAPQELRSAMGLSVKRGHSARSTREIELRESLS